MPTPMPTAAKLFAALAFTAVGFFGANVAIPHLPEGSQIGAFVPISALVGLVGGWRIMGPEAGQGPFMALSSGLKTTALIVLAALFVFSLERMLVNAFRRAYDGPVDAIVDIIAIGIDYGEILLKPDVFGVLILGGIFAGLLSDWAARRWR